MPSATPPSAPASEPSVTLFLAGDVMTGRGIDQVLPCPGSPELREDYVRDARDYVTLAEELNGPIRTPVDPLHVWGEAARELDRVGPAARIINLETSVTTSGDFWPGKGIHYRMHPGNLACLTAARIDVCTLANNHVLDFGDRGLAETLDVLRGAGLRTSGAGRDLREAQAPATVPLPGGGALHVFSCGTDSSGIPSSWGADADHAGVHRLPDLSERTAARLAEQVRAVKAERDLVVVSLHWGGNWGYDVPAAHTRFAHALVDAGVDVVHGHSSHHPRPIEVYRGRPILYGCGDLINDYEGIRGYEEFRDDLRLLYFVTLGARTGRLEALRLVPLHARRLGLERATPTDAQWLADTLSHASRPFGTRLERDADGSLLVRQGTAVPTGG